MAAQKNKNRFDGKTLWVSKTGSLTADRDLSLVLGSSIQIPLKFWRPNFFFTGAKDSILSDLTQGVFPAKQIKDKTHPVFTLKELPNHTGFSVCPCSSKRPFDKEKYRFIREGCRLIHTNSLMDRNSYLVEAIKINIPQSVAYTLRFKGEVPPECIVQNNQNKKKVN